MRRRWAGVTGIVVAMIGLIATICAEHILPSPPEPPKKSQISLDVNVGPLKAHWQSKTQDAPAPPPPKPLIERDQVRLAGTILGVAALPLAIVSWIRRERAWWGCGICAIAVAAIAWQKFVIVFAVLVFTGALGVFVPGISSPASESAPPDAKKEEDASCV